MNTSTLFQPRVLRNVLERALSIFSSNVIFLSLYLANEERSKIAGRVRSQLDMALARQNFGVCILLHVIVLYPLCLQTNMSVATLIMCYGLLLCMRRCVDIKIITQTLSDRYLNVLLSVQSKYMSMLFEQNSVLIFICLYPGHDIPQPFGVYILISKSVSGIWKGQKLFISVLYANVLGPKV